MFWFGVIVGVLLVGGIQYGKAYLKARAEGKRVIDVILGG